jgi:hypothetical protein
MDPKKAKAKNTHFSTFYVLIILEEQQKFQCKINTIERN